MRLEERLEFEKLLADLSAMFVDIPAAAVDEKIELALQRLGEALGIHRCNFIEYSKELNQLQATHAWAAEGFESIYEAIPRGNYIPPDLLPWSMGKILRKEIVVVSDIDQLPREAEKDGTTWRRLGVRSGVVIPYFVDGSFLFALTFGSARGGLTWPEDLVQRIRLLGEVLSHAIRRKKADLELRTAFSEIQELKDRLEHENIGLREEIKTIRKHPEIVGDSDAIGNVLGKIEQVAKTNSTVLILGETGTGKELVARAIHSLSLRGDRAMVTLSCASLPATLVEAELFGREKGAYTGAISKQVGRFEIADGSTIFLDEIGELSPELQVKLLGVLEKGQFERLGSSKTISVNVRVIAATNLDLQKAIREGKFREDLYYRLNVFPIRVPALRERPQDILPLTWAFVKEFGDAIGKRIDTIPRSRLDAMQRYSWPGNVRELRNVIERAMIATDGRTLLVEVPEVYDTETARDLSLASIERRHILDVMEKTRWRVKGKNGAANLLGLDPGTLYSRMKKLGITRPE